MLIAKYFQRYPDILRGLVALSALAASALLIAQAWSPASRAAQAELKAKVKPARQARPVAYRSPGGQHKLRVHDAQLARELREQGARLVADYGSFQILSADEKMAAKVEGHDFVELRDEENLILLNAGPLDTTVREMQLLRSQEPDEEVSLRLVQFAGPVKPEWYEALEATGVQIVAYVPNNAYLVFGAAATMREWAASALYVQWEGAYQDQFKLDPNVQAALQSKELLAQSQTRPDDLFAVQLVRSGLTNQATLQLIAALRTEAARRQFSVLNYVNVIVRLPLEVIERQLAARPDVISIKRYIEPTKSDERQAVILTGNLNGVAPAQTNYLDWLTAQGFTQEQFTQSNFAVNVTDSGIDNATITPGHFALYTGGLKTNASRVIYNRLEGTPNTNSTLAGCDGHGTINAHIIAGFIPHALTASQHLDASGFRYGLGIAPFVKVGSTVIFDPNSYTFPDLNDIEARAYQDGARISSNSWGSPVDGEYTIDAQAYDALVRDAQPADSAFPSAGNQEMVIVFAAGNAGPGTSSINAPGTGKNVLTVGAAENVQAFGGNDGCVVSDAQADGANDIANFSSRGPTLDGRRKPDLVAPGTHVTGGVAQTDSTSALGQALSCYNDSGVCGGLNGSRFFPGGQQFYTASSGTSHSTPAAAGAAALLRQRFINAGLTAPSPAMTKAALMNTARYMNSPTAGGDLWSNVQGMGEINLTTAFGLFSTPTILRDQLAADIFTATGQTRLATGNVADTTKPFRVTLAWTDAPGSTTGNAYVNDLNLEVTVGGQTYRGNVFSGQASMPGGAADPRNNVESVFIPAGAGGAYAVKVTAANIAGDGVPGSGGALDQDFALVVNNGIEAMQPVLSSGAATLTAESCGAGNGVIDPGETVTVNLALQNSGTGDTTNLTATLLTTGGVTNPSAPQNYGQLNIGGAAVSRPFTFTANGACGGTLTAALALQDGALNLGTATFSFTLGASTSSTVTFTNNALVTIPAGAPNTTAGAAALYPSSINVSGLLGTISKVTVKLNGFSHTKPDDMDILLVAPDGRKTIFMSDAGGGTDAVNLDLTFDDTGAALPDTSALATGTYRPTNFGGAAENFPAPAPVGPYSDAQQLAAFNGAPLNGAWSLYVTDDGPLDVGALQGGWSLTITTTMPFCCTGTACPTITVNPPTINSGAANTTYSQNFTASGGTTPINFGVAGALPAGLSLSGAALSGTPTQVGNFGFTITAVDANNCTGSRSYTLNIACPTINILPAMLPAGTAGTAYNQTLTANGGVGVSSFSSSGALPAGLTLAGNGLLSGTPSQVGNFSFTVNAADANGCLGTRNYTLSIGCPTISILPSTLPGGAFGAAYSQTLTANGSSGAVAFSVSGQLPNGLTLSGSGLLAGTPTQAGNFSFVVNALDARGCTGSRNYTLNIGCPTINMLPATLPAGQVGAAYNQLLTVSGSTGTVAFSASGQLPGGLTLASNGLLAGTPTQGGNFNFVVNTLDASGCAGSRNYTLSVCPAIVIGPATLPNGRLGSAYTQSLTQTGGGSAVTFSVSGALPAGLTLASNGVLSGTPTQFGSFPFTVRAAGTDGCAGNRAYTLIISPLRAVRADFDGDGKSDISVWRGNQGFWHVLRSSNNITQSTLWGVQYAPYNDVAVPGDYDGDGKADVAVWRRLDGNWYIINSATNTVRTQLWGAPGDTPVPADYDGDGKLDLAVWRGAEGRWRILRSSDGQTQLRYWGAQYAPYNDVPVPSDYDGDGKADMAVWRPLDSRWYIINSATNTVRTQLWGVPGDQLVPADYDGDGKTDIAVWRGSNGFWWIVRSSDGAVRTINFGVQQAPYGDIPTPGDYDGDGQADIAVWRPLNGSWHVLRSSNGSFLFEYYGQGGDTPLPGAPR